MFNWKCCASFFYEKDLFMIKILPNALYFIIIQQDSACTSVPAVLVNFGYFREISNFTASVFTA